MKKIVLTALCMALAIAAIVPTVAFADNVTLASQSKEAVLMSENGDIVYSRNALEKRPIASMTKIMTLLCVYDGIDSGKISLDDEVTVSSRAASMGGSQVFLDANAVYKLENLVKSVIVCSANDSCVALAEHLAGSVENFVESMNAKAKELGLTATHFENCTGLPAVSQYSCAADVAKMMCNLIRHNHYFECSKIWMEDFVHPGGRVTGMTNTNKLVRFYEGCDGGKTGFTNEAMHCLCATAKRGDTRFISVVVGAPDSKTRFAEVSEMLNYGFANYESKVYLDKSSKLDDVCVAGGKTDSVAIAPQSKLTAFGKKGGENYNLEIEMYGKVKAPVAEGQAVGRAFLTTADGKVVAETNLVAANSVEAKSWWDYAKELLSA